MIDGMVNRNLWLNTLIMVPTIDSIQEMRVMTSNYSAEYGAAAGAVTVVQTKSGTNQFHGDAYEFLRNDHLDANNFFSNRAGLVKPHFRRSVRRSHTKRQDIRFRGLPGDPAGPTHDNRFHHTEPGATADGYHG